MTAHTVKAYEHELRALAQLVADCGSLVERQIDDAIAALVERDEVLASRVISGDGAVNALQREIEQKTIQMIGKRQPLGSDLREIVGALRVSIDLERIGDAAKNIASRVAALEEYPDHARLTKRVDYMAGQALEQLKDVLASHAQRDVDSAIAVWTRDEEIDATYTSLFRELLTYMMEDPRNITLSIHVLFCAKNIERIGDHVTNIAETVYYMVNGEPLGPSRSQPPAAGNDA
jgi:phosphate transport system protein